MKRQTLRCFFKQYACMIAAALGLTASSLCWFFFPASGLIAEYYPNADWSGEPEISLLEKTFHDDMEFAENLIKHAGFPREHFSIAWSGWIRIDKDGVYRFGAKSDDGSFLKIDEQLVVDNGGLHASQEAWGEISLTKGMHRIHIAYFNAEAAYKFSVFWTPPHHDKPTPLAPDALFPRPISRMSEAVSRYFWIFKTLYLALWGVLLAMIALNAGWLSQPRYRRRHAARFGFNLAAQLVLIAFAVIVIADNLAMLIAKQPWRIGPLAPKPDRKMSTILRMKGGGDSDDAFCATLRALYPGRSVWLPQDDLFKRDNLLHHAGMRSINIYRQPLTLTPEEVRRLPSRVYHRFIYNPFKFRPDGEQLDKSLYNKIDPASEPKLLFLMTPKRSEQPADNDLVAIPFERNLYFLPLDQLPERIRGELYE